MSTRLGLDSVTAHGYQLTDGTVGALAGKKSSMLISAGFVSIAAPRGGAAVATGFGT